MVLGALYVQVDQVLPECFQSLIEYGQEEDSKDGSDQFWREGEGSRSVIRLGRKGTQKEGWGETHEGRCISVMYNMPYINQAHQ